LLHSRHATLEFTAYCNQLVCTVDVQSSDVVVDRTVGHDQRRHRDIQHVHRRCEVSEETRKLWRRQVDLDCRRARAAPAATPIDSVSA